MICICVRGSVKGERKQSERREKSEKKSVSKKKKISLISWVCLVWVGELRDEVCLAARPATDIYAWPLIYSINSDRYLIRKVEYVTVKFLFLIFEIKRNYADISITRAPTCLHNFGTSAKRRTLRPQTAVHLFYSPVLRDCKGT